ncbi:sarcosine oxidase subunit gamma [Quadrisphaera granulorum]|uniref:Sarcosine oxidase subunit gamma n=1 Tax=Quadrisphaera granulorum TaxID=317664 RepID=A0A316AAS7_9ACTN|nr:sarcosine oxidase subunit gamma family protein [Quadrisphaera granulorum]PWJ54110.1 sarcosine oxidase subunit gamma [Quadrisphaera granulorum]SZE96249.1 sarcosine oxidase subunit gamma [Quadrisphaera granulorum]
MADTLVPLQRTHPLDARPSLTEATVGAVRVVDVSAQVQVRAAVPGPAADALAQVIGAPLPTRPGTWTPTPAGGRIVWLGPDEWLVVDPSAPSWDLEARLRAAAAPHGGAALDVSGQRVVLSLSGEHARDLLAAGCAVDTHPSVFRRGAAAQTLLGQAGVILLALSDDGTDYELFVRSSFARYLADWLADAATEHRTA